MGSLECNALEEDLFAVIVKRAIDSGLKLDARNLAGETPLHR